MPLNIELKEETIEVKAISHPGFDYSDSQAEKGTRVCKFNGGKYALVGDKGGFFGKEPQYVEFESKHTFSCLTVFRSKEDAKTFLEFLNFTIKNQLKMSWLEAR